jgi:dihydroorotase-like cyclic amidohydrolase
MDLILRNARLIGAEERTTDIGIMGGKIADIRPNLAAKARRSTLPAAS